MKSIFFLVFIMMSCARQPIGHKAIRSISSDRQEGLSVSVNGVAKYMNEPAYIGRAITAGCTVIPLMVKVLPGNFYTKHRNAVRVLVKESITKVNHYNIVILEYSVSDKELKMVRVASYEASPTEEPNSYYLTPYIVFQQSIVTANAIKNSDKSILKLKRDIKSHNALAGASISTAKGGEPSNIFIPDSIFQRKGKDYKLLNQMDVSEWTNQVDKIKDIYINNHEKHSLRFDLEDNHDIVTVKVDGVEKKVSFEKEVNGLFVLRDLESQKIIGNKLAMMFRKNDLLTDIIIFDEHDQSNFHIYSLD